MQHFVYIIHSNSLDKFYIGQSEDFHARISYHNNLQFNKGWTARGIPWELCIVFAVDSRGDAIRLEKKLKSVKNQDRIRTIIEKGEFPLKWKVSAQLVGATDPDKSMDLSG